MDVRIQAIHFDASEKLVAFINKKAERIARHYPALTAVDVTLKVVKPETAMNKQAIIKLTVPQEPELVATRPPTRSKKPSTSPSKPSTASSKNAKINNKLQPINHGHAPAWPFLV